MVLVSYDQERRATPAVVQAISSKGLNDATPDPKVLPANIAAEYAAMMSRGHTDLQEQRFLKTYVGKHIDLSLTLARSAEHTSELQSLMRISYAVFCFHTKTKQSRQTHHHIRHTSSHTILLLHR